jgi:hypothetical protein
MGLLLPGGNREPEAQDVGNPEEEFAVFGEEEILDLKQDPMKNQLHNFLI